MKKKKPKTPEQIAQRNLSRNLRNQSKNDNGDRKLCGLKVIEHSDSAIESGKGNGFSCSRHGVITHIVSNSSMSAKKFFSKDDKIIIKKYKSGKISKDEANKELGKHMNQSLESSHKRNLK